MVTLLDAVVLLILIFCGIEYYFIRMLVTELSVLKMRIDAIETIMRDDGK